MLHLVFHRSAVTLARVAPVMLKDEFLGAARGERYRFPSGFRTEAAPRVPQVPAKLERPALPRRRNPMAHPQSDIGLVVGNTRDQRDHEFGHDLADENHPALPSIPR